MKITTPTKIKKELHIHNNVRSELLRLLEIQISNTEVDNTEDWNDIYQEILNSSEGFNVSFKRSHYEQVDRTCSMLSGPFFTSENHPAPLGKNGYTMHPIVQIDLSILSRAFNIDLGTGLLQLWFDLSTNIDVIRTISRNEIARTNTTPFNVNPVKVNEAFPLPHWLDLDPVNNGVSTIKGLTSFGLECTSDLSEVAPSAAPNEWLQTLLAVYYRLTSNNAASSNIQIGGMLQTIQYNPSEVPMRQLLRFFDWGSTGSAEIFFKTNDGSSPEFTFMYCVN